MTTRYLDDFSPGDRFETRSLEVTQEEMLAFATAYDPQPFHLDEVAGAASPYGGLIASGFLTLGLSFRLFTELGLIRDSSLGSPGMDELRWLQPVRAGDRLSLRAEVQSRRASHSRPDRGALVMAYTVLNQDAAPVMTYRITHILRRRV